MADGEPDFYPATFEAMTGLSPRRCARVLRQTLMLRLCAVPNDDLDKLNREDGPHQWFVYCLTATARRAQGSQP